jgi:hypothetical protein
MVEVSTREDGVKNVAKSTCWIRSGLRLPPGDMAIGPNQNCASFFDSVKSTPRLAAIVSLAAAANQPMPQRDSQLIRHHIRGLAPCVAART